MLAIIMTIGDESARALLTRLYEQNFSAMYKLALKLTGDHQLAEDAAMAAIVKLVEGYEGFNLTDPRGARSLMVRMSMSAAIDIMRKRQRESLITDIDVLGVELLPDPSPGAEELAMASELTKKVTEIAASLPLHLYLDYIYYMKDGLSATKIAEIDGITPDAVRKRLVRIRNIFKEKLREGGFINGNE
ncbi:MAG: sigma-70 family RNA polymerase sigma factor [Oscillospiraceae bacterium]|nr:sigma-70 family RNA polymerase sigma factor [Oscillospiraceae bacterium]